MLYLMDAFNGNDIIIITYDSKRTRELDYKKYLVKKNKVFVKKKIMK